MMYYIDIISPMCLYIMHIKKRYSTFEELKKRLKYTEVKTVFTIILLYYLYKVT